MTDTEPTPETTRGELLTGNLGSVVGYGVLVAVGLLLVVVGARDLWIVLDSGLRTGPARATVRVVAVTATGATLVLAGAMKAGYLVALAARE